MLDFGISFSLTIHFYLLTKQRYKILNLFSSYQTCLDQTLDQNIFRNNALFLVKATEEYSPGAHMHWGRINTLYYLKTNF